VFDLEEVLLPRRPARRPSSPPTCTTSVFPVDLHEKNAVFGVTNLHMSLSARALCLVSQGSEPPLKRCLPPHSRLPKVAFSPPILEGRKDEAPSGDTLEASEVTAHGISFAADP
jgi:hypothetical protein